MTLMGTVLWDDSEVVSTCVEDTFGGRFSTNTMRTWFKRTMVLGMLGTVKTGDTCRSGDCDVQVHLKSNPLEGDPSGLDDVAVGHVVRDAAVCHHGWHVWLAPAWLVERLGSTKEGEGDSCTEEGGTHHDGPVPDSLCFRSC